jgi:hypothetical protein
LSFFILGFPQNKNAAPRRGFLLTAVHRLG